MIGIRGLTVRKLVLIAAALFGGLVVVFSSALGRSAQYDPVAVLGKPVPVDHMTQLDGRPIDLEAMKGKAVLVNFWNSWCVPCQQEAPALDTFYARHAEDPDFEMVGVVHDDTTSAVRQYVASQHIPWHIALDPGSQTALAFGTTGQPETYAISPNGVIVAKRVGAASVTDLTRLLEMAKGQA
jgi:cytochrome c biogenesis protein CcmG, thiol:disulfide interchange protein DsbE